MIFKSIEEKNSVLSQLRLLIDCFKEDIERAKEVVTFNENVIRDVTSTGITLPLSKIIDKYDNAVIKMAEQRAVSWYAEDYKNRLLSIIKQIEKE